MNIVPISQMARLEDSPLVQRGTLRQNAGAGLYDTAATSAIPFGDLFTQALQNVEETEAVKQADSQRLAVGEVDNPAEILIHSQKAEVALQMAVQLRNKILDVYAEVMRMNV